MEHLLTIIDGHFTRNGEVVPTEFGNVEHIDCLARCQRQLKLLADGMGVSTEWHTKHTGNLRFDCVCGKTQYIEVDDADSDADSEFVGSERTCHACKKEYHVADGDEGVLVKQGRKPK